MLEEPIRFRLDFLGVKWFQCPYCDREFKLLRGLYKHISQFCTKKPPHNLTQFSLDNTPILHTHTHTHKNEPFEEE